MYDHDVLDAFARRQGAPDAPTVEARTGLVAEHRRTGFTGSVCAVTADTVTLRGRTGAERVFTTGKGAFLIAGKPVTLVRPKPKPAASTGPTITASGSIKIDHKAKVAIGSRIWVEGIHDAMLIEKVWGDDLRGEGVVVERLDGIDHLADEIAAFRPAPGHRLGVLVDHLVPGSKEDRIARSVRHDHVLVTGTPFVDVWQAVRPSVLGIDRWPTIDRGTDWKTGICREFKVSDPAEMWRRLLSSVRTYADLEPSLVGAVEQLIDFVTTPS
ncbi:MAG: DUF3097 family protein [Acidimicrobiia bacterium]